MTSLASACAPSEKFKGKGGVSQGQLESHQNKFKQQKRKQWDANSTCPPATTPTDIERQSTGLPAVVLNLVHGSAAGARVPVGKDTGMTHVTSIPCFAAIVLRPLM